MPANSACTHFFPFRTFVFFFFFFGQISLQADEEIPLSQDPNEVLASNKVCPSTTPPSAPPAEPTYTYWDVHPIHIGAESLYIGKAGISSGKGATGNLFFHKNMAFLSLIAPVSRTIIFIPRFEYNAMYLKWNHNPRFSQTHFNYLKAGLVLFTNELDRWDWIVRADYNFDTAHFFSTTYGLFNGLLWGKYAIHPKWHYHVGGVGYVGLEGGMLYPIIGFDYSPTENWQIKMIFPIIYSVEYQLGDYWHFAIIGRPLKERFRVNQHQKEPSAVFSYSSTGLEANIRYEIPRRLEIVIFGGCNFGGDFYIKNRKGHQPLYTDVGAAPYIGAKIDWGI